MPSICLGVQAGTNMQPHSSAARASNIALLIFKILFSFYFTAVRPYFNVIVMISEVCSNWLEVGISACIVAMQVRYSDRDQGQPSCLWGCAWHV